MNYERLINFLRALEAAVLAAGMTYKQSDDPDDRLKVSIISRQVWYSDPLRYGTTWMDLDFYYPGERGEASEFTQADDLPLDQCSERELEEGAPYYGGTIADVETWEEVCRCVLRLLRKKLDAETIRSLRELI